MFARLLQYLRTNPPWIAGTIATVLTIISLPTGIWNPFERTGYNLLFQLRPQQEWDDRIAVIGIDEKSLQEYGQFQSWSRDRYTQLLESLDTAYPLVVGFDIIFTDRSPRDEQFAAQIDTLGTVVLARTWTRLQNGESTPLEPVPILAEVAANQGQITHQRDPDGISRWGTLWVNSPDFSIANLGIAIVEVENLLREAEGRSAIAPIPKPDADLQFQNRLINWVGKTESFPTYSFFDIAEGNFDPADLQNKLVLVGFTATAADDPLRTPLNFNPATSGVYLHAAIIDNLLGDRFLRRLPVWGEILLLIPIGIATSLLLARRSLQRRLLVVLAFPPVWFAFALMMLTWRVLWIPVATPVGTLLLAATGIQLREQWEKQQLMRLFEKYVSPETASLIWQHKDEFFQEGELLAAELNATVLFMDIRSFTSISEKMTPQELFRWLNRYLDAMTACIMEHGGVVDKYIGDAIMAVFGVPFPHAKSTDIQQDAINAIAASIAMHQRLERLNEELQQNDSPLIRIGVGIHSGLLMAGSLGGMQRLNYSVVGDTVNIAARLESLNKQVKEERPYNILISRETFDLVSDRFAGKPVMEIQLRGRQEMTQIFTIIGESPTPQPPPKRGSKPSQEGE
ncbi:MAG: adenylate/guanylate cyclase domain-containing protein [Cyanobacteria bacterium P01_E01_bin.42]